MSGHAINCERLIGFIGYGPPTYSVDVLFLGIEEAGGGEANLGTRSAQYLPIEDLYDAHEHKLKPSGVLSPFDLSGNPVEQWNTAARFALALEGHPRWSHPENWSQYWRGKLGRKNGNTFLMDWRPFPRPRQGVPIPGIPRMSDEEIWKCRRPVLHSYLVQYPPRIVVAYGKSTKDKVESLFFYPQRCTWNLVHGVSKDPASVAFNGTSRICHVGFFGQGCFSCKDIPTLVTAIKKL